MKKTKAKKYILILGALFLMYLYMNKGGFEKQSNPENPSNPNTLCPQEVGGFSGNNGSSYSYVTEGGATIRECGTDFQNWQADVWHYGDDNNDLADFFVYKNGKELAINRTFLLNGRTVMFDSTGFPYSSEDCGDLWNPSDTTISRWGRTEWQQLCYNKIGWGY